MTGATRSCRVTLRCGFRNATSAVWFCSANRAVNPTTTIRTRITSYPTTSCGDHRVQLDATEAGAGCQRCERMQAIKPDFAAGVLHADLQIFLQCPIGAAARVSGDGLGLEGRAVPQLDAKAVVEQEGDF